MNNINLSYVITTRNKLPYLKEVMKRLLANIQEDEEIIVVDAASTDGTVEYLTQLYEQGKIHQFVSEPDRGEAHGYNKGFLMARGTLIKDLTDDDAYYYPAIQECKKFMLEHEEVDFMSGNSAEVNIEEANDLSYFRLLSDSERNYMKWFETGCAVSMHGLPFMLRRTSLALTGLYFPGIVWPDFEFSLRITSFDVKIAWNPMIVAVRIENPKSNFRNLLRGKQLYLDDRSRVLFFYDKNYRLNYHQEMIRAFFRPIKSEIYKLLRVQSRNPLPSSSDFKITEEVVANVFNICDRYMEEFNNKNESEIIYKLT